MNISQREENKILKQLIKSGWVDKNKKYPVIKREYRMINKMNLQYARETM